jgi:ABC-type nitrate/sulfonate/bicarbonate transport system substrate-binding protein
MIDANSGERGSPEEKSLRRRRTFLASAGAFAVASAMRTANAVEPLKVIRIGFQKAGALLVVEAEGRLEKGFESDGVAIKWAEFPFGPPMLEAMSAGAIDYRYCGDAPPRRPSSRETPAASLSTACRAFPA